MATERVQQLKMWATPELERLCANHEAHLASRVASEDRTPEQEEYYRFIDKEYAANYKKLRDWKELLDTTPE